MRMAGRLAQALLLAGALLLAAGGAASAGAPAGPGGPVTVAGKADLELELAPGLAGRARLGWVPVHVVIGTKKQFDGDLVVRLRGGSMAGVLYEMRKGLSLAPNSRTEHRLFLRHDSPELTTQGAVEAVLEDGRPVDSTRKVLPLTLVPHHEYLVCIAADPTQTLGLGSLGARSSASAPGSGGQAKERQFTVVRPALNELPDRVAGYNDVDFLLIYQVSFEKLSREQITAMGDYLARGGCVVLAAKDRTWFARPEVREFVPVSETGSASAADAESLFRALASKYGAFAGDPSGGTVHRLGIPGARDERGFYSVRRGLGHVLVWRLDPAQEAVGKWPGQHQLWTEMSAALLPSRPTEDTGRFGLQEVSPPLVQARAAAMRLNLARERSVPGLLIVFLVVLYLVLAGPINYFALRRLDMRALSILTLPLLAVVFVLLNFAVGYISRGVVSSGRRVTVAVAPSGAARADCVTWLGLFPASSSLAELSTDGRGLLMPLSEGSVAEHQGYQELTFACEREDRREERFMLDRYPLAMWKMFHFQAESTRQLGGAVTLRPLDGGRFTVANGTPLVLRDCFVAAGTGGADFCWLGDVPPGASQEGRLARWSQNARDFSRQGRNLPALSLSGAVRLWMDRRLGAEGTYVLPEETEGFAAQAAGAISSRLERIEALRHRGMLLVARVEGEEIEPLRLGGRPPRGDSVCVLTVAGEPGAKER
ncbi:MAG TPA: hypothetical protein PK280_19160 [Planctomycetota bacterium]|nr:hypothetical protein [Planctomycetota bacterium]